MIFLSLLQVATVLLDKADLNGARSPCLYQSDRKMVLLEMVFVHLSSLSSPKETILETWKQRGGSQSVRKQPSGGRELDIRKLQRHCPQE